MEKGIDAYIKEQFHLPPVDIRTYSPLTLAYIGDGIYDLIIRSIMTDYRKATGFEALMGYLYLKDEFERMVELIKIALGEEEEGKEQTF